ncbi:tRNA (adenosine(37)-N6)-threonylcarbamoyltransferase complex dimerization subunit type 1 TsaB [Ferruginibacter albus]|uniref:tRNA (adenosine(37)-N6)-threonylcarbamoyltransferase complex dimerization subunit type 1 TsaB n=1 Tax=Ferruginibacter albus TaxID=2875540 RepID=UPI001CC53D78|nr:tRNA (adenosine(37)-N6)-threonylcarbamoyltransferase complex dimerization subunit type 1 TsaB [Ferruginibacter albus]UAY51760.1 tRNA (adenosine(37)-N6)-threonylcarbamoyltransferase complex dimerization subunit type 1 TsaB [Ferruginibacter albus]
MSLLLNIDTATETGCVSIAKDGNVLHTLLNEEQKNHASFLQPAIEQLFRQTGYTLKNIDAIAVTEGPGSYTGIRIGMSSAKGLCFALNKPLILINTLEILAQTVILQLDNSTYPDDVLICPMIDARRMEVFTAVYDKTLKKNLAPNAMILTENSFINSLSNHPIIFTGSGSKKWKQICKNHHAFFDENVYNPHAMCHLSQEKFKHMIFADIAYSEPMYLKDVHTNSTSQ